MLTKFAEIDLGRFILTAAIILGFFLSILTIIRSIEIPIRIYLDKKKDERSNAKDIQSNNLDDKGFNSKE